ncbi:MAG TPA: FG-GAP-like repeat-containing protein [Bryobacteraceae bacterium]|nr:FG-GAP-like repeat-containing protein [Bryobacteraceae bacterium]
MFQKRLYVSSLAAACVIASAVFAASQKNFVPDVTFQGSALTGWHTLGDADWSAANGEITGKPKSESGGWLVLDHGYQDIQLAVSFRCSGACKSGVLLRAEKTADGMKGVYVSLSEGDVAAYDVVLDAHGAEISRSKLPPGPGPMIRFATARPNGADELVNGFSKLAPTIEEVRAANPPKENPSGRGGGRGRGGRGGPALHEGDWNTAQIILDADLISVSLNGGRGPGGATNDRMMGYGPLALYAGGAGETQFKEIAYKDLNSKFEPKEEVSPHFKMQRISDFYYGWCAAVADFNRDGIPDIASGGFYYLGPDYTTRKEFTPARTYNPSDQFSQGMVNFAYDFTGDGWPDILMVDQRPIYLYVNPRGESRRWDRYNVVPQASTEIELLKDIDGDGKPEVLFGGDRALEYAKPDPANPTAPWIVHQISEKDGVNAHGMGVGDINGDGRMDVVGARGWWEQPPKGTPEGPWKFHPENFGSGGAEMGVYDVNGDGLNDVVTGIAAHGWGLAWFEQKRDQQGNISFVRHDIMGDFSTKNAGNVTFSELHAMTFADLDGDGIPDIIVGKRQWSHLESFLDPDPYGPAVLYWYRTVRDPKAEGGAKFVPELIHNRSGVGSHLAVADLNHDGAIDIITSTNRGTFIFWNQMHPAKTRTGRK